MLPSTNQNIRFIGSPDYYDKPNIAYKVDKKRSIQALLNELSNENMMIVLMPTSVYREKFDRKPKAEKELSCPKKRQFCLPEELKQEYLERIISHMDETEAFLNHDYTIHKLAEELELSPTYTSRVINQVCGKTFRDFINGYRVKKACKYLTGDKMKLLTIEAIAMESGFHSRTAFYNAFKKVMGISPGEYIATA